MKSPFSRGTMGGGSGGRALGASSGALGVGGAYLMHTDLGKTSDRGSAVAASGLNIVNPFTLVSNNRHISNNAIKRASRAFSVRNQNMARLDSGLPLRIRRGKMEAELTNPVNQRRIRRNLSKLPLEQRLAFDIEMSNLRPSNLERMYNKWILGPNNR